MSVQPPALTRATLTAGERRFDYHRAGRGAAVVLLLERGAASETARALIAALAPSGRVIIPDRIDADASFGTALSSFLEGLGVLRAAIVAEGAYCAPALAFAADRRDSVSRVALLVQPAAAEGDLRARAAERSTTLRIFDTPAADDAPAADALARALAQFLE